LFLPHDIKSSEFQQMVSPFYRDILKTLPSGPLLEAPMLLTFPLYGIYQYWHGRKIYAGSLGTGFEQTIFDSSAGMCFRTVVSLNNLGSSDAIETCGARYLIIHKRIKEEMARAFEILKKTPGMATQITHMDWFFGKKALEILFGPGDMALFNPGSPSIHAIYEDDFIIVYDLSTLNSIRSRGKGERFLLKQIQGDGYAWE
jgi:hypothetical protein